MSAVGQRNPLQFEYLTDFWCALVGIAHDIGLSGCLVTEFFTVFTA